MTRFTSAPKKKYDCAKIWMLLLTIDMPHDGERCVVNRLLRHMQHYYFLSHNQAFMQTKCGEIKFYSHTSSVRRICRRCSHHTGKINAHINQFTANGRQGFCGPESLRISGSSCTALNKCVDKNIQESVIFEL